MSRTSGISNAQIVRLVEHTLPYFLNRDGFEGVMDRENFVVVDQWFRKERIKVTDGNSVEFRIIFNSNGQARFIRPYGTRPVEEVELARKGAAPWCHATTRAVYERTQLTKMRGASKILDYLKEQYYGAVLDILKLIDNSAFLLPDNATDDLTPWGVPYWVKPLDSGVVDYTGQFGGKTIRYADGTTSTVCAGLDGAVVDGWQNWAACKSGGINPTTLRTLRRGLAKTDFVPPKDIEEYINPAKPKRKVYMSIDDRVDYVELVNSGPDPRNGDWNPFKTSGAVTLDGCEVVGVGAMKNLAYNPIYILDHGVFNPFVHEAWWMESTEPMNDITQPHVFAKDWDCMYNFICTNLKRQVVVHDAVP